MAQENQPRVNRKGRAPLRFIMTPKMRDVRGQSIQRLQVGLFGLAAMLLLVGLANIIMDRAREAEALEPVAEAAPAAQETRSATDPLADIGVVPAAAPTPQPLDALPNNGTGN